MIRYFYLFVLLIFISSCTDDPQQSKDQSRDKKNDSSNELVSDNTEDDLIKKGSEDTTLAPAAFSAQGFDQAVKYELLLESRICNPNYSDTVTDGTVPCSSKFFRFFEYNHKRDLHDAFMLQVKAGVNNVDYRRLLIFTRERGKLVLVNGVIGYLVAQIKRPNEIDDLIVGIVDDLGNNMFDRYDVLLRYKDGKYHMKEAIGDLQGEFKDEKLKERATRMIKQRIEEKNLIY